MEFLLRPILLTRVEDGVAIDGASEQTSGRSFAGAAGADEQISMRETILIDGAGQGRADVFLTDELREISGSRARVQGFMSQNVSPPASIS